MYPMTVYLGKARLADFHQEAERDALARAARRARRAQRQQAGRRGPRSLSPVAHRARRPGPASEGLC